MVIRNEFGYPVPPKDFVQTFGRYGANIGRTLGSLVPTASGVALGAIPAGIAALGAGYAMHRGNQMVNDPAVANRMANMRDMIYQGYLPTDEEGVWIDPEGNTVNLSSREELPTIPNITVNPYQNLSNLSQITQPITSVSSAVATPITSTPNQVKETPVLQTNEPSQPTVKNTSPKTNTQATSSGPRKNTQSKIDLSSFDSGSSQVRTNGFDWLNDLLPLLAAGGLGYLLAK